MKIPFQVNSNSKMIMGILHLPLRHLKNNPFIILCYGLNGNRVENNRLLVKASNFFEENGIAFVRFDYTGLGISEGEFWEVSQETKVSDTINVFKFIKNCYFNTPITFYLLGFSDGAKIVNYVANKLGNEIDSVIYWNPVLVDNEANSEQIWENKIKFVRNPYNNEMVYPYIGNFMNLKYLRELQNRENLFDLFKNKQYNITAFFSENDDLSKATQKLFENDDYSIKGFVIKSNSHVFNEDEAQNELFVKMKQVIDIL